MITIIIQDPGGLRQSIDIPEDISLSLMEVIKASGYNMLALCGGMALCATCHIAVIEGSEKLPPPEDMELNILDALPDSVSGSRLACQIRVSQDLNGSVIQIMENIRDSQST